MRKMPGTRHRKLVLIAVAIAAVLIVAALLWNGTTVPAEGPTPAG